MANKTETAADHQCSTRRVEKHVTMFQSDWRLAAYSTLFIVTRSLLQVDTCHCASTAINRPSTPNV
jgi:hypothetical protein